MPSNILEPCDQSHAISILHIPEILQTMSHAHACIEPSLVNTTCNGPLATRSAVGRTPPVTRATTRCSKSSPESSWSSPVYSVTKS